ncbi:putative B3 domain-containing protein At5g58280 [Cannabis sativa]|uniref:TF-B3 domain-containing protein n=1 Tax=Cannabis sativa TaxID=3483 RepID=A0A803PVK8_CANSA|nr:putative B3 domain-containing protein At5g58280 [Cannabis sativa]XP_030503142.1 putative B3 domain-containing protein At5g58280 [Cannabis sativa]
MIMTSNGDSNTYEEVRKQRLEENKKRFEDLGIAKITKSLSDLTNSEKKSPQRHLSKPRSKICNSVEPRRSSRSRNPVQSYCDEVYVELPSSRKRSRSNPSSWASYLARPLDEVIIASYEERNAAFKAAEELESSLKSENPTFVKSMVRSHVYSCFWLGLPSKFCENYLPKSIVDMELEDEDGKEFDAIYIGKRSGLSGGWRAFALEHKLNDGDACVFELVEPTRFKIYIVRVSLVSSKQIKENSSNGAKEKSTGKMKKDSSKSKQTKKLKKLEELPTKCMIDDEEEQGVSPNKRNGCVSKSVKKEVESEKASETNDDDAAALGQESAKCSFRRSKRKLTPKSSRHSLI